MERLIIECGEYKGRLTVTDKFIDKLFKIFPNFKDLVNEENILQLKCFKLTDVVLHGCIKCIGGLFHYLDDVVSIQLNKKSHSNIKAILRRHSSKDDGNIAYALLIMFEYFASEISYEILFCLYHYCMQNNIQVTDPQVLSYLKDKIKYAQLKEQYYECLMFKLEDTHCSYKILEYDDEWREKLKDQFTEGAEYDHDGMRYMYYPKNNNENIHSIKLLKKNKLGIKYNNNIVTNKKEIWFIDDFNYYGMLNFRNNEKVYSFDIPGGASVEIKCGFILFRFDVDFPNGTIYKVINMISEEELYRKVVNPTIEEVCIILRQMALNS